MFLSFSILTLIIAAAFADATLTSSKGVIIKNVDPLIYYHGRWDNSPGTWWASSGLKLNVQGLSSLTLNLGNHTTVPSVPIAVSLDYSDFVTVNVSEGSNSIPLSTISKITEKSNTVVRINSWDWQDNRVNLESIELNSGAVLLPYIPAGFTFQFIGDSLSAGQYLPQGVDQAWPFLTAETFKSEHLINAQPGAALTDIVSYGNEHGLSFEFFRTEDTGYFYTSDHNYTTPWNFARDVPVPDIVVIHLGANDSGQNITANAFVQNYLSFLEHLREIYVHQPILVFTPWGWPQTDGSISYYYPGKYEEIVSARHNIGDKNIFLVNTTGWVSYEDVFPDNLHPTVAGHQKIAGFFETWLKNFGVQPQRGWRTESL